jgi:hypothetical protein
MRAAAFGGFIVAALLLFLTGSSASASTATTPGPVIEHWNGKVWTSFPSPDPYGYLRAVTVISGRDAWAVGGNGQSLPLAEHWNGATWQQVDVSAPDSGPSRLNGVAATSSRDVWAVGKSFLGTLIEHWGGRRWRPVPSPSPGAGSELTGVVALSARNAWAVGWYSSCDEIRYCSPLTFWERTLVLHWNGTRWRQVRSPDPPDGAVGPDNALSAIAAVSARDVWAVGSDSGGSCNTTGQTLVVHWNGRRWKQMPNPAAAWSSCLFGVSGLSATSIWAVGEHLTHRASKPYVERWNGHAWRIVPAPAAQLAPSAPSDHSLNDVVAISPHDAWAVGSSYDNANEATLVEHWNGRSWTQVPLPGGPVSDLTGVAAVSPHDVWAVGY